eukprot:TRINITY_DN510_c0_g1_i1.p1 TRINITY_DN510_c0_g1~~TRINITY_DN510_c0_g1_i1.p1  ORF type:complete len:493 (-),score=47.10 TRINITY_DN510_c0_g1_i1:636-2114(-)
MCHSEFFRVDLEQVQCLRCDVLNGFESKDAFNVYQIYMPLITKMTTAGFLTAVFNTRFRRLLAKKTFFETNNYTKEFVLRNRRALFICCADPLNDDYSTMDQRNWLESNSNRVYVVEPIFNDDRSIMNDIMVAQILDVFSNLFIRITDFDVLYWPVAGVGYGIDTFHDCRIAYETLKLYKNTLMDICVSGSTVKRTGPDTFKKRGATRVSHQHLGINIDNLSVLSRMCLTVIPCLICKRRVRTSFCFYCASCFKQQDFVHENVKLVARNSVSSERFKEQMRRHKQEDTFFYGPTSDTTEELFSESEVKEFPQPQFPADRSATNVSIPSTTVLYIYDVPLSLPIRNRFLSGVANFLFSSSFRDFRFVPFIEGKWSVCLYEWPLRDRYSDYSITSFMSNYNPRYKQIYFPLVCLDRGKASYDVTRIPSGMYFSTLHCPAGVPTLDSELVVYINSLCRNNDLISPDKPVIELKIIHKLTLVLMKKCNQIICIYVL